MSPILLPEYSTVHYSTVKYSINSYLSLPLYLSAVLCRVRFAYEALVHTTICFCLSINSSGVPQVIRASSEASLLPESWKNYYVIEKRSASYSSQCST